MAVTTFDDSSYQFCVSDPKLTKSADGTATGTDVTADALSVADVTVSALSAADVTTSTLARSDVTASVLSAADIKACIDVTASASSVADVTANTRRQMLQKSIDSTLKEQKMKKSRKDEVGIQWENRRMCKNRSFGI